MSGPTIGRPHGLTDREWGEMCEAWRQAGGKVVLHGGGESHCTGASGFAWSIRRGIAYRLALPDAPDPTPIPDGLPSDAVPVTWFEHEAWVVPPLADLPCDGGWEWLEDEWCEWGGPCSFFTAIRRKPEPPPVEEITPTPETLHRLVGRVTADGDTIRRVEQTATGWSAWFDDGGSFHLSADWAADARVFLVTEDGTR